MKKLHYVLASLLFCAVSSKVYAGLITHTDYTAGNVITAAGQNTNENTIVNEFNGNVNSANIATGGVSSTNILDGTIVIADLATTIQSTFTIFNAMGSYRRPALGYISVTTVDIENNTGTANQTCVMFPNDYRCVTENTGSTSVNRRFIISEAASFTGTKNSGMVAGEAEANNTWYALYAVKVQDNSTDFVVAGTTNTPSQANFAQLNNLFGTNGWVYLGLIRNGDGGSSASSILEFYMDGNHTEFSFVTTGNSSGNSIGGILLATTSGAATLSYTATGGTGSTQIPTTVINLVHMQASCAAVSGYMHIATQNNVRRQLTVPGQDRGTGEVFEVAQDGMALSNSAGSSIAYDITIIGWTDRVLGAGINPQR